MRKIVYKKIAIQNFLSVGNESIEIEFKNGLNLITGKNIDNPERKNAVGKSVIIDAFYFALFGKTIREIKKEFIINKQTKGKGFIELSFDVKTNDSTKSYKITRTLKPSSVSLYCGDDDITRDSIDNTNKFVCDLIGSNPVLCKSCDILSLNDNIPFMAKTASEKRKFIEDIFSLSIFGDMVKDLKDIIKNNKGDLNISNARLDEISNTLNNQNKQYTDNKTKLDEREQLIKAKKDQIQNEITCIQKLISDYTPINQEELTGKLSQLSSAHDMIGLKIKKLEEKNYEFNSLKTQYIREISNLSNIDFATCDKCRQQVGHDHAELITNLKTEFSDKLEIVLADQQKTSEELQQLKEKSTKLVDAIRLCNKKLSDYQMEESKHESNKNSLIGLNQQLENLNDSFKDTTDIIEGILEGIKETQSRQTEQSGVLKELKQHADDLESVKFILGEEGVKSVLIKQLLGMLNASIQKYIAALGMSIRCKFDEYFDEQISNDGGDNYSYYNLSGGERRTLDLACAWSFKDIKRKISGISSNLEFLDEILDSAFDERGFDLLIDVLKERMNSGGIIIYAISHRKEAYKHVDGEIILLEKENRITRRVANVE